LIWGKEKYKHFTQIFALAHSFTNCKQIEALSSAISSPVYKQIQELLHCVGWLE